jgi:hypothetical protein
MAASGLSWFETAQKRLLTMRDERRDSPSNKFRAFICRSFAGHGAATNPQLA